MVVTVDNHLSIVVTVDNYLSIVATVDNHLSIVATVDNHLSIYTSTIGSVKFQMWPLRRDSVVHISTNVHHTRGVLGHTEGPE